MPTQAIAIKTKAPALAPMVIESALQQPAKKELSSFGKAVQSIRTLEKNSPVAGTLVKYATYAVLFTLLIAPAIAFYIEYQRQQNEEQLQVSYRPLRGAAKELHDAQKKLRIGYQQNLNARRDAESQIDLLKDKVKVASRKSTQADVQRQQTQVQLQRAEQNVARIQIQLQAAQDSLVNERREGRLEGIRSQENELQRLEALVRNLTTNLNQERQAAFKQGSDKWHAISVRSLGEISRLYTQVDALQKDIKQVGMKAYIRGLSAGKVMAEKDSKRLQNALEEMLAIANSQAGKYEASLKREQALRQHIETQQGTIAQKEKELADARQVLPVVHNPKMSADLAEKQAELDRYKLALQESTTAYDESTTAFQAFCKELGEKHRLIVGNLQGEIEKLSQGDTSATSAALRREIDSLKGQLKSAEASVADLQALVRTQQLQDAPSAIGPEHPLSIDITHNLQMRNAVLSELTEQQKEEIEGLSQKVNALESELNELKRQHADLTTRSNAQSESSQQEIAALNTLIKTLEEKLREHLQLVDLSIATLARPQVRMNLSASAPESSSHMGSLSLEPRPKGYSEKLAKEIAELTDELKEHEKQLAALNAQPVSDERDEKIAQLKEEITKKRRTLEQDRISQKSDNEFYHNMNAMLNRTPVKRSNPEASSGESKRSAGNASASTPASRAVSASMPVSVLPIIDPVQLSLMEQLEQEKARVKKLQEERDTINGAYKAVVTQAMNPTSPKTPSRFKRVANWINSLGKKEAQALTANAKKPPASPEQQAMH